VHIGALIDTLYGFIERNYRVPNLIEKCLPTCQN